MFNLNGFIILTFCYLVIIDKGAKASDAKYDYFYERTEQNTDVGDFLTYKINVVKSGDSTFKVQGQIKHKDTTEDMEIEMTSFHSDDKEGEKEETKFKGRKNICDFMKGPYKNVIYPKFKDTSNVPTPETCPLPAEEYIIQETEIDVDKYKSFLKPGHWKIVMKLIKGDKVISDFAVFGYITEKPKTNE